MVQLRKKLFAYKKEDVDKYFQEIERRHSEFLKGKSAELTKIKEKNAQLKEDIKKMVEEIDRHNKRKAQLINYIHKKLTQIEKDVEKAQEESKDIKLEAVYRLQNKRDELFKWHKHLHQYKEDLQSLKQKYEMANLSLK